MWKTSVVFVLMLFVTLNYGTNAVAKDKKVGKNKTSTAIEEQSYKLSFIQFNMSIEKLPPNFKGTDIVSLYSTLKKKAPIEKGEFETTADYEKRISAAITYDLYAFKLIDYNMLEGLRIRPYNADTQQLQIDIEAIRSSKYEFNDYRSSIIIRKIDKPSRSYIGSNAFGAKVLVDSRSSIEYRVALVNEKDFGIKTITFDMLPEEAKVFKKNNIGILLLCKPMLYKSSTEIIVHRADEVIFESTYYSAATIDSPISLSYHRKFINVEILSIWVYQINTGTILLKKQLRNKEDQKYI